MANKKLTQLTFSFFRRTAPRRGVRSSDQWNDSFDELSRDLSQLRTQWNTKLLSLIDTLPDGTISTTVDAFNNGLDGRSIYIDSSVSSSSTDQTYFNSSSGRPQTLKESVATLRTLLSSEINTIRAEVAASTAVLTDAQKNAIGINIFDTSQASSSTSIDGKAEINRKNLNQLRQDVYGAGGTLDGDSAANLSNSIFAMVDALLELHNGDWDTDVTLDHSGVGGSVGAQTDVPSSASPSDSYAGSPTTTEDDLNQVRTRIKAIAGTATWTTALTALYSGGADSLYDLLVSTAGSATKSATNPWGYRYDNIDGLETRINATNSFVGQDSQTDATPAYSSVGFITQGASLESAIGQLDNAVVAVSGIVATGDFLPENGTGEMTGDLLFEPDGEVNIGQVENKRPNQLFLASGLRADKEVLASGLILTPSTGGNISWTTDGAGSIGLPDGSRPDGVFAVNNITSSGNLRTEQEIQAGGDVFVTASGSGVVGYSPDGTKYRIRFENGGGLIVETV